MSTDVEAFDLACRAGDIDRVRSLVEAGFEAYLYVDQIWKTIFDTAQDRLFEWLVDYIRRHPLNAILAGGLYKWSECQILQYRLYVAIRDSQPLDTVYDLMSKLSEYTETTRSDAVYIDVALIVKLIHISPAIPVVEALRMFLLEQNLKTIRNCEMWNRMEIDDHTFDEIADNRAMDYVEVLWRYVGVDYSTERDNHRRHWAWVHKADPEIRDRILRLMVSAGHHTNFTRYDLLQSLLSAGYPDLHARVSEEYAKAGLEVRPRGLEVQSQWSDDDDRLYGLTLILHHTTTIPDASVTVEEIRRLLSGNTLEIDDGSYSSSLVISLLYSAISHGARDEIRHITFYESDVKLIDPDGNWSAEFIERPSPCYQHLQRYFDGHNRDVRALVTALDGEGILCRNVLGVVCDYLEN